MRKKLLVLCTAAVLVMPAAYATAQESTPESTPDTSGPCVLSHSGTVNMYSEPQSGAASAGEFEASDTIQLVGQVAGWWAVPSGGMSAGAMGTQTLDWVEMSDDLTTEGNCDSLMHFFPIIYSGDICTALTNNDGMSYDQPDSSATSTEMPGIQVAVLAKTSDGWLGYDPATGSEVGVDRLNWLNPEQLDSSSSSGNCDAVPVIDPTPLALTSSANGESTSTSLGDTITITLEGNPTTGYSWSEAADDSQSILQAQGAPVYNTTGTVMPGSGGEYVFTFVAVADGDATINLNYARPFETDAEPAETFTTDITVAAASGS